MCEVLLVNTPLFRHGGYIDEDYLPPIGLGYIATSLDNCKIPTEIIDCIADNLPLEDIISKIEASSAHFVGMNIFSTNYDLVKEIVESVRRTVHIIIGGISTKFLYGYIFRWKTSNCIDIVYGDGEYILLDIIKNRLAQESREALENKKYYVVDSSSQYFVNDISSLLLNRSFFKNEPHLRPDGLREASVVASRGCVYNCAFCSAARSLNLEIPVRVRGPGTIMRELREIKDFYSRLESVRILDDLFLIDIQSIRYAISIFNGVGLSWRSMAHIKSFRNIDWDLLCQLEQSGLFEVFIGIESGSPRILELIKKGNEIEEIRDTLTKLFKAGINVKGYFMFGFPAETEEDFHLTYDLARLLKSISEGNRGSFRVSVFQFRPYHGTKLYGQLDGGISTRSPRPNAALSSLIGREQFNFSSGNYSAENDEVLHHYIAMTDGLNKGNSHVTKHSIVHEM